MHARCFQAGGAPVLQGFAVADSPLGVVLFAPECIVGFVHEHAVLEEHGVHQPPEEEQQWEYEEELPVRPRDDGDESGNQEEVEERALRAIVEHFSAAVYPS